MENHLKKMQELLAAGTSFIAVTLVDAKGSTPRAQGGRMLVTKTGLHSGTVGGGLVEAKALEFAADFFAETNLAENTKFVEWNLNRDAGMSCGGSVKLFFERFNSNPWEIVIFGAGHVAQALIPLLLTLECQLSCIDTREEWLSKLPDSSKLKKICVDSLADSVENISTTAFLLIMTQGHRSDFFVAQLLLAREGQPFVGVIGSRSKAATLQRELKKAGLKKEQTERLFCPLGFSLGGNHPQEIAISITAQLLYERDKLFGKLHPRNPIPKQT
ncbi:MAG: xanthine dehydrogenase accessory protein XdhC [SAR324 cluster bacterium]|nr:xanthine dehydrogenase accessory protein XdhC [SAR324 cluster bacterium]MBL7034355.1 xanthine dehydrogenase accessory protein XdhC [SAR324 cluster bacterium]